MQFTEPQGNALKFRGLKGKELDSLFINFLSAFLTKTKPFVSIRPRRPRFSISPKAFLPFPSSNTSKPKDAPPPLNLPQEGILLGKNFYRGDESLIYMKDDDRRRHFYLIGQTGTGKSVLLKNMIVQDMEQGKGVCYIDPHGSDLEDILSRIPKKSVGRFDLF